MEDKEYTHLPLNKQDLQPLPLSQFSLWYNQAIAQGEIEPTAFTLATGNTQGEVTARVVLLKTFDKKGFVFFTNYLSLKSQQLQENPKAAMVFWWPKCQRQVRICGVVEKISPRQSDAYFKTRPKASQIAAIISKQSEILTNRETLLQEYDAMAKNLLKPITRPDFWGGYVLEPHQYEFWQGRTHRLHDRFQYIRQNGLWDIVQLYP